VVEVLGSGEEAPGRDWDTGVRHALVLGASLLDVENLDSFLGVATLDSYLGVAMLDSYLDVENLDSFLDDSSPDSYLGVA
jgi:hypothetical protein